MDLDNLIQREGVYHLSDVDNHFSDIYLKVRDRENRLLSDDLVALLPNISSGHPHFREWILRKKTALRFKKYLLKRRPKSILEIGCGNGWFTNFISTVLPGSSVIGLDINILELEQAARVFKRDNLHFVCGDIFKQSIHLFSGRFQLITLNASIQYFPDIQILIKQLKKFLTPRGEIHIMDSFFYDSTNVETAKHRTIYYYSQLGYGEMVEYYHHHSLNSIRGYEILFAPKKNYLFKLLGSQDSPFPWVKIINDTQ